MNKLININIIGVASGIAAQDYGCGDGPLILEQSQYIKALKQEGLELQWQTMLRAPASFKKGDPVLPPVAELCEQLAKVTEHNIKTGKQSLTIGGDHACAVGTWSGVCRAKKEEGPIGLIWIDAHMDSHTPETTESGAIHGMPLAALLGYGDEELTNIGGIKPKVLPENVVLVGVRSYESGEAQLLDQLKVKIYFMDEIKKRGIKTVMQEAIEHVTKNTVGYGISLDLDGIDPQDAPGVGTPEANGISGAELCEALGQLKNGKRFLSAGIVEFNPHHDKEHKTEKLIARLIKSIYS